MKKKNVLIVIGSVLVLGLVFPSVVSFVVGVVVGFFQGLIG